MSSEPNSDGAKYILSYGAGVNSTALLVFLVEHEYPLNEVVFADTGGELPETYMHLKVTESYLRDYGIQFKTVRSNNGTLYDCCMRRKVIPSQIWRWSTRDYKITPIYAYYRSLKSHVFQYLGIAYEEQDRAKKSGVEYVTNVFPLIENKLTRYECISLINKANLSLPARSGCFFCPFNSISRWKEIHQRHMDLYFKAKMLEENSKHFPKQRLMKLTLGVLEEKLNRNEPLPTVQVNQKCGSECLI